MAPPSVSTTTSVWPLTQDNRGAVTTSTVALTTTSTKLAATTTLVAPTTTTSNQGGNVLVIQLSSKPLCIM